MSEHKFVLHTSDGEAPTEAQVKKELLSFWDAFSPLSLKTLYTAYETGQTLSKIGVDSTEARASAAKYNSLILRGPGKGPLVSLSEAETWESATLEKIVKTITNRSQLPSSGEA